MLRKASSCDRKSHVVSKIHIKLNKSNNLFEKRKTKGNGCLFFGRQFDQLLLRSAFFHGLVIPCDQQLLR
jgi:hypothetical protein